MINRAELENYESDNHKVRPLEERLCRIFRLPETLKEATIMHKICKKFSKPIIDTGQLYSDTIPILTYLKNSNYKLAIISNTPWGIPSNIWKEELIKMKLVNYFNVVTFCVDIGWRKPAPSIYLSTLSCLRLRPDQCLFIGDDPITDIKGAQNIGIQAILIDRNKKNNGLNGIARLSEIINYL